MILPELVGRHSTLRALLPSDAPSIALHADDPEVWRNLFDGFPRPYTLADAEAWCGDGHRQPAVGHVWAIDVQGQAVGCIGLRPDGGWLRCNAEVGYWIGRAFWRRGICGEALAMVRDWAFVALPQLTRLYAPIFAWNEGSMAVARHAGFVAEGRFPASAIKGGQLIDRVQYGCVRPGVIGGMPTLTS
ncbi:MAG: GNAT family N-acetyltransferase [Rubrivivax sp.]